METIKTPETNPAEQLQAAVHKGVRLVADHLRPVTETETLPIGKPDLTATWEDAAGEVNGMQLSRHALVSSSINDSYEDIDITTPDAKLSLRTHEDIPYFVVETKITVERTTDAGEQAEPVTLMLHGEPRNGLLEITAGTDQTRVKTGEELDPSSAQKMQETLEFVQGVLANLPEGKE